VPSKKSAIDSILGVSDGSSTLEERLRKGRTEPAEVAAKERKEEESPKSGSREGGGEATAEKRVRNESAQNERTARKRTPGGRGSGLHTRILGLKLDTETEQTAKASYYLTPEQTKRLDDLRAAFRHEGGYAPRDASYSRIVGLAIERLHEEIFSSSSRG
jgi:hypothetical protein